MRVLTLCELMRFSRAQLQSTAGVGLRRFDEIQDDLGIGATGRRRA